MLDSVKKLSEKVLRKFINCINVKGLGLQIESDEGWTDIDSINKTIPYKRYKLIFESGNEIDCADNHIFITIEGKEIFAKDAFKKTLKTNYNINGDKVIGILDYDREENMYDFSLSDDSNHLYYANGVLSHNSTLMTIVACWTALFFPDQTIAIIANKQATATEIFNRVRLAFLQMENWIKGGVVEFNKTYFTLANGSRIITSATSPDAIRGYSIDVLLLDEFAIIPPKDAEAFWAAVTPSLSTRFNNNKNAKLIVCSTPKGVGNKFHELVSNAESGKNDFNVAKAMWYDVPGRDESFKEKEISTMGYEMFMQEYECKFLNGTNSPFDPSMFTKFDSEMIEPINKLDDGNYLIWKEPDPSRIYAMGVDTSEGLGQDYSVAQIFDITDPLNIEQVARYSTNTMSTVKWGTKLVEITNHWFQPILAIERNGPGTGVADKFFTELNYPRLLNYGFKELGSMRAGRKFVPGIISLNPLKNTAIRLWRFYAETSKCLKLYDKTTINELRTFMMSYSGSNIKWAAQAGFHDDHIMSMVWAIFTLHKKVVDNFLIVKELNGDAIPVKIERRWDFHFDEKLRSPLYDAINDKSPYISVMVTNDSLFNKGIATVPVQQEKYTDPLAYLLDNAANQIDLNSYYKGQNTHNKWF